MLPQAPVLAMMPHPHGEGGGSTVPRYPWVEETQARAAFLYKGILYALSPVSTARSKGLKPLGSGPEFGLK